MPPRFARSDVMGVNIAAENGGCGRPGGHSRPVINGAPVKLWRLDCGPCSDYLKNDPLWSLTEADLPETPDEVKGREDFAKRGATDRDNVLAIAMAKLAGVELPQTIRQAISGASPEIHATLSGTMVCENGHDAEPGAAFCDECGAEMRPPATNACPQGHQNRPAAKFCATCRVSLQVAAPAIEPPPAPRPARKAPARKPLRDMRAEDLRQIARDRGLSDAGSRLDLIERIRQAKVPAAA
jgi:hypothetical protein